MKSSQKVDEWLLDQFSQLANAQACVDPPTKKIAIISTPRCGSTFLCESLASTGRLGNPSEWLNPRRMAAYGRYFGLDRVDLKKYLMFVISHTTTSNGVFSLNFHVDQYIYWRKQKIDPLAMGFDRVLYISRRDKIAQAYSYAKAMVTDQWRSEFEPAQVVDVADIRNGQILDALKMQSVWDETYSRHLDRHVHARFVYEEMIKNPTEQFRKAMDECGVDHRGIDNFMSGTAIQRNEQDQARVLAFRTYLGCIKTY
jgi:LPS sulfotransferase NodH